MDQFPYKSCQRGYQTTRARPMSIPKRERGMYKYNIFGNVFWPNFWPKFWPIVWPIVWPIFWAIFWLNFRPFLGGN